MPHCVDRTNEKAEEALALTTQLQAASDRIGATARFVHLSLDDGQRVPVLRDLLTLASPVFSELLVGDDDGDDDAIPVVDHAALDILRFVSMLYPTLAKDAHDLDVEWVRAVMPIAHKYDVETVVSKCLRWVDRTLALPRSSGRLQWVADELLVSAPQSHTPATELLKQMDALLAAFADRTDWGDAAVHKLARCIRITGFFVGLRPCTQARVLLAMEGDRALTLAAFEHTVNSATAQEMPIGRLSVRDHAGRVLFDSKAIAWWVDSRRYRAGDE